MRHILIGVVATIGALAMIPERLPAQAPATPRFAAEVIAGASISRGPAMSRRPGHPTTGCSNPARQVNTMAMPAYAGDVVSSDGKTWVLPPTEEGAFALDYYNDCNGTGENTAYASQLETIVIDPDGVELTGFIFADNYFELWVNGTFVGRDSIAMTPFNTHVVRFRARYPITYAVKAVDWETHHGIGMEYDTYNIGDGGFIAYFSDGTRTGADWRVETFYVAPLDDPSCVRATPSGRDSTYCHQGVRPVCAQKPETCYALHVPVPDGWRAAAFDDSRWAAATTWPPRAVTGDPSYVRVAQVFRNAEFIWTKNLRLDNLVLARYTAQRPAR